MSVCQIVCVNQLTYLTITSQARHRHSIHAVVKKTHEFISLLNYTYGASILAFFVFSQEKLAFGREYRAYLSLSRYKFMYQVWKEGTGRKYSKSFCFPKKCLICNTNHPRKMGLYYNWLNRRYFYRNFDLITGVKLEIIIIHINIVNCTKC